MIRKIFGVLFGTVGKYEVGCMWFGLLNFTLLSHLKHRLEKVYFFLLFKNYAGMEAIACSFLTHKI